MKNSIVLFGLFVGLLCCSTTEAGTVTFDQTQLLGMDVYHTVGSFVVIESDDLTAGPGANAYNDGTGDVEFMTGVAGSNEFLGTNSAVYYTLNNVDLAALNGSLTSGDLFRMIGFNDNGNDNWMLGIWYEDDGDGTKGNNLERDFTMMIAAGSSVSFSLVLPGGPLDGIGVFVASGAATSDQFHASWSPVPEPTSMAIMGLGTLLAGFGVRRRKRKMAELAA